MPKELSLIGLTVEEAKDLLEEVFGKKVLYRATSENGNYYIITRDFTIDRFNFTLQDGLIIEVRKG